MNNFKELKVAKMCIFRLGQDLEVTLDGERYKSVVHGTYHQLDTSDVIMLGSANNKARIQDLTRGHFTRGFQVPKAPPFLGLFFL